MRKTESGLTDIERRFLQLAQRKFRENADWFEFEDFAFGMRSPLFSRLRSHRDVLTHPLYVPLRDMWLQLGVKQGRIAPSNHQKDDATRRKTTRRR